MDKDKFVILFAGVPGSSKTPISYYLSWNLNLPVLNNDAIRTEVTEDHGRFDQDKYLAIRDQRLEKLLASGLSFIYDASIDRVWPELKGKLEKAGYEYFVINIELDKEPIRELYKNKDYTWGLEYIDKLFSEHQDLVEKYSAEFGFEIGQKDFDNRLELAKKAVERWLKS